MEELTITRAGNEAVASYTGRSVEVDLYRDGEHLDHISGQAEWQHYATLDEMLTAAAESAIQDAIVGADEAEEN